MHRKTSKNSSQSVANSLPHSNTHSETTFNIVDNRSIAIAQSRMQEMANSSPQVTQTAQLQKVINYNLPVIQCINSNELTLAQHGNVAKAPTCIGAGRFSDAGTSIHQVSLTDFPGESGTIVDGSDNGARIDKQGNFNAGGKSWANIQVQANRTSGGTDYTDLIYPEGTQSVQKGTSFAEVHVDNRIVASEKEDVLNRGKRLLKQGLIRSRGDRNTSPRRSFRITYD